RSAIRLSRSSLCCALSDSISDVVSVIFMIQVYGFFLIPATSLHFSIYAEKQNQYLPFFVVNELKKQPEASGL
ncbi:MAG TPA: hypothetical protein VK133_01295, partial [Amoebophilaceae bacterium]|nr:hypothetical protein [Amoebophilaceae bacterium]